MAPESLLSPEQEKL